MDQRIRRTSADTVASASASNRLVVLDALRGLAALGILWRNIFVFGMPTVAFALPEEWGETVVANVASWLFVVIFVDGTMRGLFSLIFGATAILLMERHARAPGGLLAADLYFRRLMWLIVFGIVHGYLLLWPHDVLYVYGILGMFLFVFRNVSGRTLLAIALVIFVASSLKDGTGLSLDRISSDAFEAAQSEQAASRSETETSETPADSSGSSQPQEDSRLESQAAESQDGEDQDAAARQEAEEEAAMFDELERMALAEMDERLASYTEVVRNLAPETFQEQTTLFFSDHILDVGAMMFFGMALYRLGAFSGRWKSSHYAMMTVAGLCGGALVGFLVHGTSAVPGFENWSIGSWDAYLYNLRRLLIGLGLIGLVNLLVRRAAGQSLLSPFVAVGRIPLTTYIGQTVICVLLFYGFGFGLFGSMEHHQLLLVALAINAAQIVFALAWQRSGRQGPMEWLLRWLTQKGPVPPTDAGPEHRG